MQTLNRKAVDGARHLRPPRLIGPCRRMRLAASTVSVPELPAHLSAELDELEKSAYCGTEGTYPSPYIQSRNAWLSRSPCHASTIRTGRVIVREAPKDVPHNGKKYHIHTFGCQVRSYGRLSFLRLNQAKLCGPQNTWDASPQ
jgi:hypothetical protein